MPYIVNNEILDKSPEIGVTNEYLFYDKDTIYLIHNGVEIDLRDSNHLLDLYLDKKWKHDFVKDDSTMLELYNDLVNFCILLENTSKGITFNECKLKFIVDGKITYIKPTNGNLIMEISNKNVQFLVNNEKIILTNNNNFYNYFIQGPFCYIENFRNKWDNCNSNILLKNDNLALELFHDVEYILANFKFRNKLIKNARSGVEQ